MFKKIIVLSIAIILLSGCGIKSVKVNDQLTENEIISYVQNQIYNETGDEVEVEIKSKDNLTICTYEIDGCVRWRRVEGAYSYKLNITNEDNFIISSTGTYEDGYIKEYKDGRKEVEKPNFENGYLSTKGRFLLKNEFINALKEKTPKYYIHGDGDYNIYINSSEYDKINSLILKFNEITKKYLEYTDIDYKIYVFKDENFFNSINFELFEYICKQDGGCYTPSAISNLEQVTGKEFKKIMEISDFNSDLFKNNEISNLKDNEKIEELNSFNYFIFEYYGSTTDVKYNNKRNIEVYGVK